MSDYVKRTVTIEKHPHQSLSVCISIHPCQHGNVMKNIVANMGEGGGGVEVEKYMFIFLKCEIGEALCFRERRERSRGGRKVGSMMMYQNDDLFILSCDPPRACLTNRALWENLRF